MSNKEEQSNITFDTTTDKKTNDVSCNNPFAPVIPDLKKVIEMHKKTIDASYYNPFVLSSLQKVLKVIEKDVPVIIKAEEDKKVAKKNFLKNLLKNLEKLEKDSEKAVLSIEKIIKVIEKSPEKSHEKDFIESINKDVREIKKKFSGTCEENTKGLENTLEEFEKADEVYEKAVKAFK